MKRHTYIFSVTALLFVMAFPALAYVGPGPGLTMIGSLFTLVGGVIVALAMVLLWPLRLLVKRVRARKPDDAGNP